jgi:hypothetical protein
VRLQKITYSKKRAVHKAITAITHKHLLGVRIPFETVLLQLDFAALLRERTRMATHGHKAIAIIAYGTPTNAVACTDLRAVANLQDPSIANDEQGGVNATIGGHSFTSTLERSASLLQMSEALFAFGVDHAGTPNGTAESATRRSAVEQAKAPVTSAVHSYLTIQGVPVATHCHWCSWLGLGTDTFFNVD